jgi:HAD superfamily hydrolase (TIGR01509 family)
MAAHLRAVFFDAGNTLLFPRYDLTAQALTRLGYPATEEDFRASERAGKARLDEWLWPQIRRGEVPRIIDAFYWEQYFLFLRDRVRAPADQWPAVAEQVINVFKEMGTWSVVLPDTPPFLAWLQEQGYILGVISNSIGIIEAQLTQVGLRRYMATVIDSHLVKVEKPHPEIFQIALDRVGVPAAQAVFVGDTNATDMGGAQLAGLKGVLIDRVGAYHHTEAPRITALPELRSLLDTP